jgi:Tol biopolymer transport system component
MSGRGFRASVLLAALTVAVPLKADLPPSATTRVSVDSNGTQANFLSFVSSVSHDGRLIAFQSVAHNLVPGDTNGTWDIFVHNRDTGLTTRVSVATGGTEANQQSWYPAISANGRAVSFNSSATNLVAGDTNGATDIFVRDLQTGVTERVSVASDGSEGNLTSAYQQAISANGRYVAFRSEASNLVPGDTNGSWDIFVRDREAGTTTRVSVANDGSEGNGDSGYPSISADGRYVAFSSSASNLVPGDTNAVTDVFVRDRTAGTTTRVSVATGGAQGNSESQKSSMSAEGRYIAFESGASNLVPGDTNGVFDIFVHDRVTATTTRTNVANGGLESNLEAYDASISADGRIVTFASPATNLVPADTNGAWDIFVRDLQAGSTTRVSVATGGTQANGNSNDPALSGDGRTVAFRSDATNLVAGDTNAYSDVFANSTASPAGAPKGLTANASGSTVALGWSPPAGGGAPTSYTIQAGSSAGLANLANFSTGSTLTAYTAPDVANGLYFLRVLATNALGLQYPSNEIALRVGPGTPEAPTGLTAGAAGSTVTLSWTAPATGAAPTSYTVEAGAAPGLSNLANFSTGSTATSFIGNGVASGTYYVRVRATNLVGASAPSNEALLQVGPPPPGPPGGLTAAAIGSTILLTWAAPATGGAPTSYTVEAGSAPGLSNLATVITGSTTTSFGATGVANGTYYVRVRAANAFGTSLPSNEAPLYVGCAHLPNAPFAWQTSTSLPAGTLQVNWTAVTGPPVSYLLEAGSKPGLSDLASLDVGNVLTFTAAGVAPGNYYLQVRGKNACGIGPASNIVMAIMP